MGILKSGGQAQAQEQGVPLACSIVNLQCRYDVQDHAPWTTLPRSEPQLCHIQLYSFVKVTKPLGFSMPLRVKQEKL